VEKPWEIITKTFEKGRPAKSIEELTRRQERLREKIKEIYRELQEIK